MEINSCNVQNRQLSFEENCRLRTRLNGAKILGLGLVDLNCRLIDVYLLGRWTRVSAIPYAFRNFLWVFKKLFRREVNTDCSGVLLVSLEPAKERSIGLFTPLVPFLQKERYKLTSVDALFSKLDLIIFLQWLRMVPRIILEVTKGFRNRDGEMARHLGGLKWILVIDSLVHSLWVLQLRRFFKKSKFHSVLVESDRDRLQALIILAAQHQNVTGYTFVHGAIYTPERFVPLIADKCIVWGEKQKLFFQQAGEKENRLVVGGNPRFNSLMPDAGETKRHLKIPADKKIILHASQNFPDLIDHLVIRDMAALLNDHAAYLLLVKAHPSQDFEALQQQLQDIENVLLLPMAVTAKEALSMALFTITVSSTFAIDAMIATVPVAVFQPGDSIKGVAIELVNDAKVPWLKTQAQMNALLSAIDTTGIDQAFNMGAQRKFVEAYCKYVGDASAAVISDILAAHQEKEN